MPKTYKVHSAAMALPRLAKGRYNELKDDIKEHGIRLPLLVNKKKDTVLDGRHRLMAAHDLNLSDKDIPLEIFDGTEEEAVTEIVSRNIMRRDLTDDQRAASLAKLLGPTLEKQAAADREAGVGKGKAKGTTAQRLSKTAKVSQHKARQALDTAKHSPKDLDKVIAGKEKLTAASKKARAKAGKTAKPKAEKTLRERVEAKFVRFMESFAVTEYKEVRAILRDLLEKAEK